jgi:hypothetical protein
VVVVVAVTVVVVAVTVVDVTVVVVAVAVVVVDELHGMNSVSGCQHGKLVVVVVDNVVVV